MDLIENLKEERLARRKAKVVEERLKNIKKIRHRRVKLVLVTTAVLVLLGLISGIATNIIISRQSSFNVPIEELPDTTEEPAPTPTPAADAVVIGSEISDGKPAMNSDGYMVLSISGINFAYPNTFTGNIKSESGLLSLTDSRGDAEIVLNRVTASAADSTQAMKNYIDANSFNDPKASISDSCYSVTGVTGDAVHHRFGRVENGTETYYELIYPITSANKAAYEANAAYMDEYLKSE